MVGSGGPRVGRPWDGWSLAGLPTEVDVVPSNETVRHLFRSPQSAVAPALRGIAASVSLAVLSSGCMTLAPQLPPTDFEALEKVEDRDERERLYAEEQIYRENMPQGTRYTKGTDPSTPRSWQSLDAVLRSDANSAAALPTKQLRRSRLFAALTVAAGILTVAGAAASAREGLNLGEIDPAGGVLLGGGLATVGFAITSGVFYGKSRKGYEQAVDIYNDSLGMRLGILDGEGNYLAPRGALVDADGNVVLDPGDVPPTGPEPLPEAVAPDPTPDPQPDPQPDATPEPTPEAVAPSEPASPETSEAVVPVAPTTTTTAAPEVDDAAPAPTPEPGLTTAALRLQPRL